MREDAVDIRKWVGENNCFEVMGQLRRLGVLTNGDIRKAMSMPRRGWIEFMMEKIGVGPETKTEKGDRA